MMSGLESAQRFLLSALVLVLAAWAITWIASTALRWAGAGDRSGVIVPFQISGKGDEGAAMGKTLAMHLQGRLQDVRRQLEVVDELLRSPLSATATGPMAPPELPGPQRVSLSEKLFEPLDVSLSLGGLEVGGVIKRLQELSMRDRALRIAVHFDGGGAGEAVVSADLSPLGLQPLWFRASEVTPSALVDQVAFEIARLQQAQSNRELGLLAPAQFLSVVETLHKVAGKNEQVRKGLDTEPTFSELLDELEALETSLSRWPAFLRIEAQVAENAREVDVAERLYRHLAELQPESSPDRAWAEQRLASLARGPASSRPERGVLGARSDTEIERRFETLRQQVGLSAGEDGAGVTVAVFGAMPPSGLLDAELAARVRRLGAPGAVDASGLGGYTAAMIQQVSMVAPEAEFIVVEVEDLTTARLVASLDRLLAEASGGIALLPLGPLPASALSLLRKTADRGWTVVVSVGNDPNRANLGLLEAARADELLVVGSVNDAGEPSDFSVRGDGVLYAPGERIPIPVPVEGMGDEMTGTGPASALAAGVAARLLSARQELTPRQLVAALRGTATSRTELDAPVLDFEAALAAIVSSTD